MNRPRPHVEKRRRVALAGIVAMGLIAGLGACSSDGADAAGHSNSATGSDAAPAGSSGDVVTLRFAWWGSDDRIKKTQGVIQAFEKANPDIKIQGESTDWSGYWDKLATMVAGGDAPDIMQMDEKYLREYADRGALLDMSTLSKLDTSTLVDTATKTGVTDKGLMGIVSGINATNININPKLFEAAGVPIPDDKTWTWDDLVSVATAVSKGSDGVYGLQNFGYGDPDVRTWARSNCGEDLWTADGKLGYDQKCMTGFFEYVKKLNDSGAEPDPSVQSDWTTNTQDQSGLATGKAAMSTYWSNQIVALSATLGSDLDTLMVPGIEGAKKSPMWYKPSMFYSVASTTKYPEQVGRFLDFVLNSQDAANILLTERGVPVNTQVRDGIMDKLDPLDARVVEYVNDVADVVGDTPPITPPGGGTSDDTLRTYTNQVEYGTMSPADAAKGYLADLQAGLDEATT